MPELHSAVKGRHDVITQETAKNSKSAHFLKYGILVAIPSWEKIAQGNAAMANK